MDFVEIAKAWMISMNPTPEQESIANSRIEICNTCEHKKSLQLPTGGYLYTCGLCGCPLQKKIYSPKGPDACPGNKWEV